MSNHRDGIWPDTRNAAGNPTSIPHNEEVGRSTLKVSKDSTKWDQFVHFGRVAPTSTGGVRSRLFNCGEMDDCPIGRTTHDTVDPPQTNSLDVNNQRDSSRNDVEWIVYD